MAKFGDSGKNKHFNSRAGPEFTTQYIIYCSRAPKESRAVVFHLTPSPTTARDACPGNRAELELFSCLTPILNWCQVRGRDDCPESELEGRGTTYPVDLSGVGEKGRE